MGKKEEEGDLPSFSAGYSWKRRCSPRISSLWDSLLSLFYFLFFWDIYIFILVNLSNELCHMVLNRLQYIEGVGFHIFEHPSIQIPHLEGVWIPTVHEFLNDINGSLEITKTKIQPLQAHRPHIQLSDQWYNGC